MALPEKYIIFGKMRLFFFADCFLAGMEFPYARHRRAIGAAGMV